MNFIKERKKEKTTVIDNSERTNYSSFKLKTIDYTNK